MSISVGEVIAVNGVKVSLRIFDDSNKETLFFAGAKYKGVSIREYIAIQRGFRSIVCIVEGEYLDERRTESSGSSLSFARRVDVKPIGYFEGDEFKHGIKFLPMIRDIAYLLPEAQISKVFGSPAQESDGFVVGRMLKEDIPISLPWRRLFNSHIGIFGNTGSGKSNTLAKLYTVLFSQKKAAIQGKSKFIVLDFNGEYTSEQLASQDAKLTLKLSTQGVGDKFVLAESEFWSADTLAMLFQATQNTQRPFLVRLVDGRNRFQNNPDSLTNYAKAIFRLAICAARPKAESLDLLRSIAEMLGANAVSNHLRELTWHATQSKFYIPRGAHHDAVYFESDGAAYDLFLREAVDQLDLTGLDPFLQLVLRSYLQLIRDVTYGYVHFDHIQPLLKRMESSLISLRKVIEVGDDDRPEFLVTVISLKKCNNEIKKILPLLLAKHFYNSHKDNVEQPPNKTLHLIVDEAHNILSQQSSREHESWKDYRLEMFEEIIKEGRKFGVFITISSQRPADISPTIVSQLHNFFIHRLVNEKDLFLIDNTITTLDSLSRSLIPNLSQGCCVVTGTSFDLPLVVQIDPLKKELKPDSEDVDLELLWGDPE